MRQHVLHIPQLFDSSQNKLKNKDIGVVAPVCTKELSQLQQ
jgi:hypothetical protein